MSPKCKLALEVVLLESFLCCSHSASDSRTSFGVIDKVKTAERLFQKPGLQHASVRVQRARPRPRLLRCGGVIEGRRKLTMETGQLHP